MVGFLVRRSIFLIPLIILISIVSFTLIQLPPGDFLSTYIAGLQASGVEVGIEEVARLRRQYGLDQPIYIQYYMWMRNILFYGQFGRSFTYQMPVTEVLRERLPMTIVISLSSIVLIFALAIPIAVYSATHQYSWFDYFATFLGFIGLATPNFLLALVGVWLYYDYTGVTITGLFSRAYVDAPWSLAKVLDLLSNIWLPLIVIATAGTAAIIRILRATLLDELKKQYVVTARAKGVSENRLLFRYPVRIALNPVISTIGWLLPSVVSGEVLVAIVLNLRTVGPALLEATLAQDMYLAGSIVLILSVLTIVGTLMSDLLLAWMDPRIRYDEQAAR